MVRDVYIVRRLQRAIVVDALASARSPRSVLGRVIDVVADEAVDNVYRQEAVMSINVGRFRPRNGKSATSPLSNSRLDEMRSIRFRSLVARELLKIRVNVKSRSKSASP